MNNKSSKKIDTSSARAMKLDKRLKVTKKELSFFVTEECNLNCNYCYLPGKNKKKRMTFDIAKRAIDYTLQNYEMFQDPQLIIDFIGGEPLLEIDLIDQIVDYFKVKSYNMQSPWFGNYKIMITTNGTLCKRKRFESFLRKNLDKAFVAVSLDGNREKHNHARKYLSTGNGSYDDAVEGFKFIKSITKNTNIKATFSSGDLKHLKDSIISIYEIVGPETEIFANVVYEDVWKAGDDKLFESQLMVLADYIIDNDLHSKINLDLFSEYDTLGRPNSTEQLNHHWCNSGQQISVAPDGTFYPCNRFHEIALHNFGKRSIGNVYEGLNFDKLRPFRVLTLTNCSEPDCLNCEVGMSCGMCSGLSYDDSETGTIFNRTTYNCMMHKARVRASKYYWDRLRHEKKSEIQTKNFYISQIQHPRKVLNIMISSDSVPICGYSTADNPKITIPLEQLKEAVEFCDNESYFINFIFPSDTLNDEYLEIVEKTEAQRTIPYHDHDKKYAIEDGIVFVIKSGQVLQTGFSAPNVILVTDFSNISSLSDDVSRLFQNNIMRINVVFDLRKVSMHSDFNEYRLQLEKVLDMLVDYYKANTPKYLNLLTDILSLEKMNNCEAGVNHVTLGPDGKFYICPAFYFTGKPLKGETLNISPKLKKTLSFDNAHICKTCDAFHCRRCVFDNVYKTDEYNIPSEIQCVLSHIEREKSMDFQQKLRQELKTEIFKNQLAPIDYLDPLEIVKVW